ncbi:MAG: lipopolysaccharide heptosyltransferase II [Leptospiraceae bacterium]|nr:lipopolysaccharide heptosyltransferase II [Leptospiraceae bacterium]MCP5502147.1 lipopolysaccharide heptosyltransferase II [Leptospiraceae bacterium]
MNILIIQTAFIGDLILTTPFIREVKKQYPDSSISLIVNAGLESIIKNNPYVDEIIGLDKKKIKKSQLNFFRFIKEIRRKNFAICFSSHFSFRSSLISFFSGAKERVGYKQSGFSFLHTKKVNRPLRGKHEVDKLFSLLYESSELYPEERRPEIYFSEEETKRIRNLMKEKGVHEKEFIIIAPSSVWETKRLPVSKFQELIHILHKEGHKLCLIGSPSDKALSEEVLNHEIDGVFNFTGETNLKELAYLISSSKAIISNDSSPIHFASAFNIPTLAVFGATIPDFGYTPLSEKYYISEVSNLDCRPCGIHGGNKCPQNHFNCMNRQNPDEMWKNFKTFL